MHRSESGLYLLCLLCSMVVAVVMACASPRAAALPPVKPAPPVVVVPVAEPVAVAPPVLPPPKVEPVAKVDSPLVAQIRVRLPGLRKGMTRSQVERALGLDTGFHGVVNSQGTHRDFGYYYDLGDWELVLRFDYQGERDGSYLTGTLAGSKDT